MTHPLTDRPRRSNKRLSHSKSTNYKLETARRTSRTLFPRLPSADNLHINPQTESDLTARTKEACRRSGVRPSQILPIDKSKALYNPNSTKNKKIPQSVIDLRVTFAEKERLCLLKQIDAIRNKLIDKGWTGKARTDSLSFDHSISFETKNMNVLTPEKKKKIKAMRKEFGQNELKRNKKGKVKSLKINTLISKKWEDEARRMLTSKRLQRGNDLIEANKRHNEYIQNIVNKTALKNKNKKLKSEYAQQNIQNHIKQQKDKINKKLHLKQKQIVFQRQMTLKERAEHRKRENARFKQHRLQFQRVKMEKKQYNKQRNKQLRKKHKSAQNLLQRRRSEFEIKKQCESKEKRERLKAIKKEKRMREELRKEKVTANIQKVEAQMKEVARQKAEFRAEMKRRGMMKNDRVSLVQHKNEQQRWRFEEKLNEKERETQKRIDYYRQQKEEEVLLRKEMSKLRKRQRRAQAARSRKKEEYETRMLEKRLEKRDQRLALRDMTRKQIIAQHKRYNDQQRLLRAELGYQFEHLTEDEVTSPIAIKRLSTTLGCIPSLEFLEKAKNDDCNQSMQQTEEE